MTINQIRKGEYESLNIFKGFTIIHGNGHNSILEDLTISLSVPDNGRLLGFALNLSDYGKDDRYNCYMYKTSYYQSSVYNKEFNGESELGEVISWIVSILDNLYEVIKNVKT